MLLFFIPLQQMQVFEKKKKNTYGYPKFITYEFILKLQYHGDKNHVASERRSIL